MESYYVGGFWYGVRFRAGRHEVVTESNYNGDLKVCFYGSYEECKLWIYEAVVNFGL